MAVGAALISIAKAALNDIVVYAGTVERATLEEIGELTMPSGPNSATNKETGVGVVAP